MDNRQLGALRFLVRLCGSDGGSGMMRKHWNRCDMCGRFIAIADFDKGAVRELITPDSYLTIEEFETLCIKCVTHWNSITGIEERTA